METFYVSELPLLQHIATKTSYLQEKKTKM